MIGLLHSIRAVDASQTLRCWTEGITYNRQGDHHVGHCPICDLQIFLLAVRCAVKIHAVNTFFNRSRTGIHRSTDSLDGFAVQDFYTCDLNANL